MIIDNSKDKKPKDKHKNAVVTISHNEYKDVLLINKCLGYSIYRIQSKDHRIRAYEINKISLSCFDDKIYLQKMDVMDWLLVFGVNKKKTVILITI